jgi:hypothetical protein
MRPDKEGHWIGIRNHRDMLLTITTTVAKKMVDLKTNCSAPHYIVWVMEF